MPLDGFKIGLPVPKNFGKDFEWNTTVNRNGEISSRYYKDSTTGYYFKVIGESYLEVKGSFHKASNEGLHNYNTFTHEDAFEEIRRLSERFKINLNTPLQNIELGFNIETPFKVDGFLNSLILWKGKPFNVIRERDMNYFQITNQRFAIKIYNKGLQYQSQENIVRLEIKVFKMEHLSHLEIKTLSDLLEIDKLRLFADEFMLQINHLVSCEPSSCKLPKSVRNQVNKFMLPSYWIDLKNRATRMQFKRELDKFRNLIKAKNLDPKLAEIKKSLMLQINRLSIGLKRNICLVTSLDISMQKKESKFLSTVGLKFYRDNHPEIYSELKSRLSSKWSSESEQIQLREIAHSIRNEYFNKYHNAERDIANLLDKDKLQLTLFDNIALIDAGKLKLATA